MLRQLLHRLPIKPEARQVWIDRLIPSLFGQLGEDAVIDNHLGWLGLAAHAPGMYLDIGAHHPTSGSNTYRFYRRGAQGIAIDIGIRKQELWQRVRPRDRFINAAVVPNAWPGRDVTFQLSGGYGSATDHVSGYGILTGCPSHLLNVPALRAGDLAADLAATPAWMDAPWRVLNLDIEGLDEQVLCDLDLQNLIPDIVVVECFQPADVSVWDKVIWIVEKSSTVKLMTSSGYSLQSVCGPSLVFVRIASKQKLL